MNRSLTQQLLIRPRICLCPSFPRKRESTATTGLPPRWERRYLTNGVTNRLPPSIRPKGVPLVLVAGLLSLTLTACSALLPPPISRFEVQTPRPFGYLIGDEIRHRIVLETRKDMAFDANSLPARGELNRWLNLNQVDIRNDRDAGLTVIDLSYQVFYAPNEVKLLTVPGFSLRFTQAGKTVEQAVPPWQFTLSPMQELSPRKDENGRPYLRPDAVPASTDTVDFWLGVYAALMGAGSIGLYLAYLYGYFPNWPQRRVFKHTLRLLGKLSETELEQALAAMHHAFNTVYGKPLFRHTVGDFLTSHPQFRSVEAHLLWFYEFSNQVLFGGRRESGSDQWQQLQELCRLCREIECGAR